MRLSKTIANGAILLALSCAMATGANYDVQNTNNSGAGSLRQAILDARANPDVPHTIRFQVGGTIALASSLPAIETKLTIDGNGNDVTLTGSFSETH